MYFTTLHYRLGGNDREQGHVSVAGHVDRRLPRLLGHEQRQRGNQPIWCAQPCGTHKSYHHTVLATLLFVFSFAWGHLGPYPPFRIAVVMTVSAFYAPILCQYNGVDTGTVKFYVCMITNFTIGAVYTVLFNQLVLPW